MICDYGTVYIVKALRTLSSSDFQGIVGNLSYIGRDLDLGELGGQLTFFHPAWGTHLFCQSQKQFEV